MSDHSNSVAPAQAGAQVTSARTTNACATSQGRLDPGLRRGDEEGFPVRKSDLSPLPGGKPVPTFPEGARFQTLFSRDKQVRFLEALALWGGVRAACSAVHASPQTVYRHRRASRDFALAWDAALLVARPHVEDVLADRALNGIEEVIWYHGEEIGRRRRYDSRLLLAHLARLDKVEEYDQLAAIAHGFDEALDRLRAGKPVDPCEPEDDDDEDEDGAGERAVYGERWEDETLPFPERAELYHRWLHGDGEDAGDADDEQGGEDGDDDELPDPCAPDDWDDDGDDDGDGDDPLSGVAPGESVLLQDTVTPVTPEGPAAALLEGERDEPREDEAAPSPTPGPDACPREGGEQREGSGESERSGDGRQAMGRAAGVAGRGGVGHPRSPEPPAPGRVWGPWRPLDDGRCSRFHGRSGA